MHTLLFISLATLAISLVSLSGIIILSLRIKRTHIPANYFVSFAAGILLATAFLNILPETLEELPAFESLSWAMYGVILAFLMERSFLWYHHHHDDTHNIKPTASLVLVGDGIHNFIDGIAIAAAFLINPSVGITTTIAIAAHEIPQELADYAILRHCGMSKYKALFWNFVSALTSLIGGILGFYLFQGDTSLIPYALALTAGIFIYVSSADLIPELHHSKTASGWFGQTLLFLIGIGLIMITASQLSHDHPTSAEPHLIEDTHDHEQPTHIDH
jgi:zinc and cadmium transporter